MKKVELFRYEKGKKILLEDIVVSEKIMNIFINHEFIESLIYSNGSEKELCIGFLFIEGFINSIRDIKESHLEESPFSSNFYVRIEKSDYFESFERKPVAGDKLFTYMKELLSKSEIFSKTGGTHISGCANKDSGLITYFEDISRKSTIYKCSGSLLSCNKKAQILLTSGRIFEYTVKFARRMNVSFVVSQSAPTDKAIHEAQANEITLVGFLRGNRFNIYSHPDFII